MTQLRFGLFGCGGFGRTLAFQVNELDGARVVATYNRTFSKAEALAEELGARAFVRYEELLEHGGVDAVVIATSHDTHMPLALAAAAAGKHIFCEKPMAVNVVECQAMIDAARSNGVKLMVGHVTRLLPLFSRMKEIIDSGEIGRPLAVFMTRYHPIERHGWWARRRQKGGMLHSPASHEIDYLNFLCGGAVSVYAVAAPQIQKQLDYEDTIHLTVRYSKGAIGSVAASISSTLRVQAGLIVGELGGLRYDVFASSGGGIIEYQRADGELRREPTGEFGLAIGIQRELRNFVDSVLYDAEILLTAEAGLRAVEVMQAAYQSVTEGKPVMLPLPRS